jgi:hypothetical protein
MRCIALKDFMSSRLGQVTKGQRLEIPDKMVQPMLVAGHVEQAPEGAYLTKVEPLVPFVGRVSGASSSPVARPSRRVSKG